MLPAEIIVDTEGEFGYVINYSKRRVEKSSMDKDRILGFFSGAEVLFNSKTVECTVFHTRDSITAFSNIEHDKSLYLDLEVPHENCFHVNEHLFWYEANS